MHKIKKYQWPSSGITAVEKTLGSKYTDPYTKYLDEQLKKSSAEFAKSVIPNPFTLSSKPVSSQDMFKNTQLANKWSTQESTSGIVPGKSGATPKFDISSLKQAGLEFAPQAAELGLQALGVGKAEVSSGGEQLFSKGADMAFQMGMKSGNPIAMGIGAGLKGLDLINQFGGKTSKQQGTTGLETGPYDFKTSTLAGKKFTMLGNSKRKKVNTLTQRTDIQNLLAGNVSYQAGQENLAAGNTAGIISGLNQQKLYGGINPKVLVAKNGAKIKPAHLRNLVNKITKFKKGGKLNLIPDGALHARKHNMTGDIVDDITTKGIPVISYDNGGEITQHAEIEVNEIIFNKEVTDKLEALYKKYDESDSQEEKDKVAIQCGKLLTKEILDNTDDRTGLLETIE